MQARHLDLIYDGHIHALAEVGHLNGAGCMLGGGQHAPLLPCSSQPSLLWPCALSACKGPSGVSSDPSSLIQYHRMASGRSAGLPKGGRVDASSAQGVCMAHCAVCRRTAGAERTRDEVAVGARRVQLVIDLHGQQAQGARSRRPSARRASPAARCRSSRSWSGPCDTPGAAAASARRGTTGAASAGPAC